MYVRTSFHLGVQKRAKLEKRVCFWSCSQIWKGHNGKIKKQACINAF